MDLFIANGPGDGTLMQADVVAENGSDRSPHQTTIHHEIMQATRLPFLTLDVFTTERYAGNPLAIVCMPPGHSLTQEEKQVIAREFNYSETVILHGSEAPATPCRIDIFTPTAELPFAGHPTIGSAYFLSTSSLQQDGDAALPQGVVVTKAGSIPYRYDKALEIVSVEVPHDLHIHKLRLTPTKAVEAGVSKLVAERVYGPPSIVSIVKGMTFALIEVPSTGTLSAVTGSVSRGSVGGDLDSPWFITGGLLGTYYFVNHGKRADGIVALSTRLILGSLEDPATGSAASALSGFLAKKLLPHHDAQDLGESFIAKFEIEQGVDMGRRSKILTEVWLDPKTGDVQKVILCGSAVKVMEGFLTI